MTEAFFVPDGDLMVPQPHTIGPWDARAQHAGPPSALLARALERCEPRDGFMITRVTNEILKPVPLDPLVVSARVDRPGRSVEYLTASITLRDGTEVMRSGAWRIRTADTADMETVHADEQPKPPSTGEPLPVFHATADLGYWRAMEWRFVRGAFLTPGPATAWLRMLVPLVPDEQPTGLQRVMVAADSGNGISATRSPDTHYFINTDLTVNLHREAEGEWICLDAESRIEPNGIGLAEAMLWDERGRIGRASQSLLVGPRG